MEERELAATVRSCGPDGGSAVADDGAELTFAVDVVDPRLRVLHPGQRVRLRLSGTHVQAVTLVSLPWWS